MTNATATTAYAVTESGREVPIAVRCTQPGTVNRDFVIEDDIDEPIWGARLYAQGEDCPVLEVLLPGGPVWAKSGAVIAYKLTEDGGTGRDVPRADWFLRFLLSSVVVLNALILIRAW